MEESLRKWFFCYTFSAFFHEFQASFLALVHRHLTVSWEFHEKKKLSNDLQAIPFNISR